LPEEFLAFAEGSKGGGVIQVRKNNKLDGSQFFLYNIHNDALTGFAFAALIIQGAQKISLHLTFLLQSLGAQRPFDHPVHVCLY